MFDQNVWICHTAAVSTGVFSKMTSFFIYFFFRVCVPVNVCMHPQLVKSGKSGFVFQGCMLVYSERKKPSNKQTATTSLNRGNDLYSLTAPSRLLPTRSLLHMVSVGCGICILAYCVFAEETGSVHLLCNVHMHAITHTNPLIQAHLQK